MANIDFTAKNRQKRPVEIDVNRINFRADTDDRCSGEDFVGLRESVGRKGITVPIIVRHNGSRYEIIDGQRRAFSAKLYGFRTVPCIVREMSDRDFSMLLLVEDIKRHSRNFFEEAEMIESLINSFGLTQEDAAARLGRAQSTIANKLRLLRLTREERQIIVDEGLTERHARALLRLGSSVDRLEILRNIAKNRLNVEQTEVLIENFIGTQCFTGNIPRERKTFHDMIIFINIFNKMLDSIKSEGINVNSEKIEDKSFIEYRVRMPIKVKNT